LKTPTAEPLYESDPLLRALIRRSTSSRRRRFRRNIVWVQLAPLFLLVPAEFLRRSPCRRVQLPIPLTPTRAALIVLLDRFRSADE
jgi:hypothetical protein